MLNVHLVPHTHDDEGWLKTIDRYCSYSSCSGGVVYIIDSVVTALAENPSRKLIYVGTAFSQRW